MEFRAICTQSIYKVGKGGVAGPQIMRCTEQRHHAPRLLRPGFAEYMSRGRIAEHPAKDVAIIERDAAEVAEKRGGGIVPGQEIPPLSGEISGFRQAGENADEYRRCFLALERLSAARLRKRAQVGQLDPVELQGAAERLHRLVRRRNGTALFQLDIPLDADAGAVCYLLTLETGRATPLPSMAIAWLQARTTGTQEVSEGAVRCHAMVPRLVQEKTSILPVLLWVF